MSRITERELVSMRVAMSDLLSDTCSIQTASTTADDMGGNVVTYATAYSNVPCRMAPGRTESVPAQAMGAQLAGHVPWIATLPYDQTISAGDRVIHSGTTYSVLSVQDTQTSRMVRRALLRRVE